MSFDIETSVGFLLAKAHQCLYAHFRDILSPYGITPPQFALLAFLWKQDGLTQAELSEKTGVDRTTLSGMIDRLEKQDMLVRCPRPGDRRACQIALTPAGKKLEAVLTPLAVRLRLQISNKLEPGEYEQLRRMLIQLRGTSDE